jgi:hypothetical protein
MDYSASVTLFFSYSVDNDRIQNLTTSHRPQSYSELLPARQPLHTRVQRRGCTVISYRIEEGAHEFTRMVETQHRVTRGPIE